MTKRNIFAQALRESIDPKNAFFFIGHANEEHHGDFHIFSRRPGVSEAEAMDAAVAVAQNFLRRHRPELLKPPTPPKDNGSMSGNKEGE